TSSSSTPASARSSPTRTPASSTWAGWRSPSARPPATTGSSAPRRSRTTTTGRATSARPCSSTPSAPPTSSPGCATAGSRPPTSSSGSRRHRARRAGGTFPPSPPRARTDDGAVTTSPTLDLDPTVTDAADVARRLGVDPATGLSSEEAARRLATDGPNELRSAPPVPLWRRVLAQFQDPLVYLLLVAVGISLVAWLVEGPDGAPVDAIVILAVVVLNAVIGLVEESKAQDAVAALSAMTAATSTVLRDGELRTVPSAELVRGDILVLSEGDAVGADARVLSASNLRVQEASLTGESAAVSKSPATLPAPVQLGDRTNMVHKGTAVPQGVGRAVVTATGMATEMGAIAELLEETREDPTPLDREVAQVSKLLGVTVVVIALVVMVVTALVNDVSSASDLVTVLLLGVSLAVAAVPEGLPAILSMVLAIGVQRMARRRAVVKQLGSVETLGSASVICTDKTGTLTRNEMTVERVLTASGEAEVTGIGYAPEGDVVADGA